MNNMRNPPVSKAVSIVTPIESVHLHTCNMNSIIYLRKILKVYSYLKYNLLVEINRKIL